MDCLRDHLTLQIGLRVQNSALTRITSAVSTSVSLAIRVALASANLALSARTTTASAIPLVKLRPPRPLVATPPMPSRPVKVSLWDIFPFARQDTIRCSTFQVSALIAISPRYWQSGACPAVQSLYRQIGDTRQLQPWGSTINRPPAGQSIAHIGQNPGAAPAASSDLSLLPQTVSNPGLIQHTGRALPGGKRQFLPLFLPPA